MSAKNKKQIIISLTSFPAAISFAVHAIKSILNGSVLPDKIVLYLTASQFPDRKIPAELAALKGNQLFEVRFYEENIRSYTKLIPALKDFPDDIIITVDDDVLYHRNLLKSLLCCHKKYPDAIVGHRIRRIEADAEEIKPYLTWKLYKRHRYFTRSLKPSFRNMAIGVGGVLYPPHSLTEEMLDSKLFMQIAPTVDDIWFYAAAIAKGTKIAPVAFGYWRHKKLKKPDEICLKNTNISSGVDVNCKVLKLIMEKYPVIKQRFEI